MMFLICPICAEPLNAIANGVVCANKHQFDRAREGYFNLLPVQFKHSREPGDAKQQLQARRVFLQSGLFSPLVDHLLNAISCNIKSLLDIGCGEGYFTRALQKHCPDAQIYGIDIAKAAVKLAAKSAPAELTYAVASSYALPIADNAMDVITRIYAPSKDEELLRVLKPAGKLIIITPGENHLLALRKKIYKEIRPHPTPVTPEGFCEVSSSKVNFDLTVTSGESVNALLRMTPFLWRMSEEIQQELTLTGLQDQADFQVVVYQPL